MADKTDKKPGFVARAKNAVKNWAAGVAKFVRDTRSELKKVVWPSKEDTKKNTTVVWWWSSSPRRCCSSWTPSSAASWALSSAADPNLVWKRRLTIDGRPVE